MNKNIDRRKYVKKGIKISRKGQEGSRTQKEEVTRKEVIKT